jgi:hypothetical protein
VRGFQQPGAPAPKRRRALMQRKMAHTRGPVT